MRRLRSALALGLLLLAAPLAPAQPVPYGTALDPLEAPPGGFNLASGRAVLLGGPAYLGAEWRLAGGAEVEGAVGRVSFGVGGRVHLGTGGLYQPAVDQPYDLLRLVRYVRVNPTPLNPVFIRLGPIERLTLGPGHLVDRFGTTAAWDRRGVGVQAAAVFGPVAVVGFTEDVRLDGVVGGRVEASPFPGALSPRLRSFRVGVTGAHDLGLPDSVNTTAFAADVQVEVLRLLDFRLVPYVSYARLLRYGSGVAVGARFGTSPDIDVARAAVDVGLFFNGDAFLPGYFNPFYTVDNPEAAIWNAAQYYDDRATFVREGRALAAASGSGWQLGLEALVYGSFELGARFRRHYGGRSESELRLAFAPGGGDLLRFELGIQRQGLDSFFSLFRDLEDENLLVFNVDYPIAGPVWLVLRSRYGYRRVASGPDGLARYLEQRRFEPLVGVRARL